MCLNIYIVNLMYGIHRDTNPGVIDLVHTNKIGLSNIKNSLNQRIHYMYNITICDVMALAKR